MTDCKGRELQIGDEVVFIRGKKNLLPLWILVKSLSFIKIVTTKMNVVLVVSLIFWDLEL